MGDQVRYRRGNGMEEKKVNGNDSQDFNFSEYIHQHPEGWVYNLQQLSQMKGYNKIIKIELEYCRLTSVPNELWEATKVRDLSLAGNQIRVIQDWIFLRMRELREFNIAENLIKSLPASLAQAENLTSLNLNSNRIKNLPSYLFTLKLTKLDISSNDLRSLPPSFEKLLTLEELTLDWFRYTTPPMSPIQRKHKILVLFAAIQADQEFQQKKEQQQMNQLKSAKVDEGEEQISRQSLQKVKEDFSIQSKRSYSSLDNPDISKFIFKESRNEAQSCYDIIPLKQPGRQQQQTFHSFYNQKRIEIEEERFDTKNVYEGYQTEIQSVWDENEGGEDNYENVMSRCYQEKQRREFGFMKFIRVFSESIQLKTTNDDGTIAHEAVKNQDAGALFCIITSEELLGVELRDSLDLSFHSPLSMSIELEHYFCAKILIEAGADVSKGPTPPLLLAVASMQYYLANDLLEHGASVAQTDEYGNNCLHKLFSLYDGYDEMYKMADLLLLHGANPNQLNKFKLSPLHIATMKGNCSAIKYAVAFNQRNPQSQLQFNLSLRGGEEKNSILHIASEKCFSDIIEVIIQSYPFSLNYIQRNGLDRTPFSLGQRHSTISKLLKKAEICMISAFASSYCFPKKQIPSISSKFADKTNIRHAFKSSQPMFQFKSINQNKQQHFSQMDKSEYSIYTTPQSPISTMPITEKRHNSQFIISPNQIKEYQNMNNSAAGPLTRNDSSPQESKTKKDSHFSYQIRQGYSDRVVKVESSYSNKSQKEISSPNSDFLYQDHQILNRIDAFTSNKPSEKNALEDEEILFLEGQERLAKVLKKYEIQLFEDYEYSSSDENEELALMNKKKQKFSKSPQLSLELDSTYLEEQKQNFLSSEKLELESSSLKQHPSIKQNFLQKGEIEKQANICHESVLGVVSQQSSLSSRIESLIQLKQASSNLLQISQDHLKYIIGNQTKNFSDSSVQQSQLDTAEDIKEDIINQLSTSKQICKEAIEKVFEALLQERDALKASRKYLATKEIPNSFQPLKDQEAIIKHIQLQQKSRNDQLLYLFSKLFPLQFSQKQFKNWKHRRYLLSQHAKQLTNKYTQVHVYKKADHEADQDMMQNMIAYFESAQTQQLLLTQNHLKNKQFAQDKLMNQMLQTDDEYSRQVDSLSNKLGNYSSFKAKRSFLNKEKCAKN